MGVTETLLNITFFAIDIKRIDVLYTLPAKTPDAGDFSQARFDSALELSPHLTQLFSDTKMLDLNVLVPVHYMLEDHGLDQD